MSGIHNSKTRGFEKPFPGCLGRMVNLFDLSAGMPGNRMLTDRPHLDGSPLSRSRSDVARVSSPTGDQVEDKLMVSELSRTSNRKSNGTPMKMLIAQEMSKEVDLKHNPPNVVAKLMGLDAFPGRQPDLSPQRSHSNGYSRNISTHSGIPLGCWQQEHGFFDKQMQNDGHCCQDQNDCKDVYEIWQQSQKTNYIRDKSPQKGRQGDNANEKKMALVRQKFIEAKRLATDEKLRQSKEFQDALEVLSSNKDLFLKFLQEPNSLFTQHLYELQSIPAPSDTKRITVLKPSKVMDNNKFAASGKKSEKQIRKPVQIGQANADEYPPQPTRIVVLKPSPCKAHEIKVVVSPPSSSPRVLCDEDFHGEPDADEACESREVAKEITRQMRENLSGHRRDETLLLLSFTKSENEFAVGNLSDSEVMSPTSRHSWDYINRLGSPFSSSSFSRASYSPESSVCREAKKRLSERWAMMASNGSCQEQKHVRRSSSTLGEMLALSDIKRSVRLEEVDISKVQDPRGSTSCVTGNLVKDEEADNSPRNLLRSKSVPVSSTVYGARLNVEVSHPEVGKTHVPKELTKAKSTKSSFKGKVSSLFFSRSKKSSKEKSGVSQCRDESSSATAETLPVHTTPGKVCDDVSQCANDSGTEEGISHGLHRSSSKPSSPDLIGMVPTQSIISNEAGLSVAKPVTPGNPSESQDQPSPISVLEPPFEEDYNTNLEFSGNIKTDQQGTQVLVHPLKSNLIDKSPRIESIARTLSWDDSCTETATPYPLKSSLASSRAEEDEQDWLFFVQTLLSAAGFDDNVQTDSFFSRWHSPETPLDPALRDKYAELNDKEILHEAKRRQRRSNRKLVFDCVNAALVDITDYGPDCTQRARSYSGAYNAGVEGGSSSPILVERVWARMKEWFSGEVRCVWGEGGDNNLVVESVVRKEVVGKGWVEHMRLAVDNIGKEIEGKLLEELVEEAVVELTGRV
ncbi:hypothetical protein PVL29_009045 [Vitis rotundifolia]|uniref:DUF3741 domain-containing protein n=1 Tax=Vitis rotundifolia TaxID=103349 RepID=A0AA38ZYE3_VITRO|nr:hypothetical protein PVL29_009045 [Vitis rotundifolia]